MIDPEEFHSLPEEDDIVKWQEYAKEKMARILRRKVRKYGMTEQAITEAYKEQREELSKIEPKALRAGRALARAALRLQNGSEPPRAPSGSRSPLEHMGPRLDRSVRGNPRKPLR